MAVETDVSNLREERKRKSRSKYITKIIIVLATAGIVLLLILTKNRWYPALEGILQKIPSPTGDTVQDSETDSDGRFPITSDSSSELRMSPMNGCFAVVDDSRFYIYGTDGRCIIEKQHIFTNPILNVSDKKALIYDLGGNRFSLESKYKTIYEKTTDTPILLAELSSNDIAAVVTKSDKFLAQLDIYSAEGICMFTYKSSDSRITGVTFCTNGCYVTTLGAKDGQITTGLIKLDFSSDEAVWKSDYANTMPIASGADNEGNIVICGDDRCVYFDHTGSIAAEHIYDDELKDYCLSPSLTAVLLENKALRKNSMIIVQSGNCTAKVTVQLPADSKRVYADGNLVYVLTGSGIYTYSSSGQQISEIRLTDSYENFCKIDGYIFLRSYDRINRISAN